MAPATATANASAPPATAPRPAPDVLVMDTVTNDVERDVADGVRDAGADVDTPELVPEPELDAPAELDAEPAVELALLTLGDDAGDAGADDDDGAPAAEDDVPSEDDPGVMVVTETVGSDDAGADALLLSLPLAALLVTGGDTLAEGWSARHGGTRADTADVPDEVSALELAPPDVVDAEDAEDGSDEDADDNADEDPLADEDDVTGVEETSVLCSHTHTRCERRGEGRWLLLRSERHVAAHAVSAMCSAAQITTQPASFAHCSVAFANATDAKLAGNMRQPTLRVAHAGLSQPSDALVIEYIHRDESAPPLHSQTRGEGRGAALIEETESAHRIRPPRRRRTSRNGIPSKTPARGPRPRHLRARRQHSRNARLPAPAHTPCSTCMPDCSSAAEQSAFMHPCAAERKEETAHAHWRFLGRGRARRVQSGWCARRAGRWRREGGRSGVVSGCYYERGEQRGSHVGASDLLHLLRNTDGGTAVQAGGLCLDAEAERFASTEARTPAPEDEEEGEKEPPRVRGR
ncbi:hypothetical protein AcV7_006111 [Taiwanofungus camphoratus]|nr:hypothetical protein AcV7_006111 [Antrodia cinnamomea]